jgi:hypothetical protein
LQIPSTQNLLGASSGTGLVLAQRPDCGLDHAASGLLTASLSARRALEEYRELTDGGVGAHPADGDGERGDSRVAARSRMRAAIRTQP